MENKPTSNQGKINKILFQCDQCSKAYTRKYILDQHLKVHAGKPPIQCPECGKPFIRNADLTKHMVVHIAQSSFQCDKCGRAFKTAQNLQGHIERLHTEQLKSFKCTELECEKSFVQKKQLTRHLLSHRGERPFQCQDCGKGFATTITLQNHIKAFHTQERQYKCTECEKGYITKIQLTIHMREHTGFRPYQCKECEKEFTQQKYLTTHHLKIHAGEEAKIYKCKICHKGFARKSLLKKHIEIHATEKKYLCGECGARFVQRCGLVNHRRIHLGIKPHKCTECEQAFIFKTTLQTHMLTHTGEKAFKCDQCEKTFARKYDMQNHSKIHSHRDKSFICKECGRSCKTKGHLNTHMQIHFITIGKRHIKSHHCKICNKLFYSKGGLNQHRKTHFKIKTQETYICDTCGVLLNSRQSFKNHQNIHLGIKPYECNKCKNTFTTNSGLRCHERQRKCDKLLKCPTCYKSLWSVDKFKSHMTMHARKNKFKPTPAIQKQIKRIQSGNNPGHTDPINESQLSTLRNIYEKENKTPDSKQIRNLSKRLNLTLGQIQDYFKYKNEKELLAKTKIQLSCSKNELKVANNYLSNDEPHILIPRPLNGKGLFVYENKQTKIKSVRSIGPNEETVRYFHLYMTSWGPLGPGAIEKGIAIGYTNLYDVRKAAKAIWRSVLYRGINSCTYRFEFKERGWHPRNKTAIPLGVYSDSVDIIRELKWWFRLFLQAMGTLHPHEVIEEYHHIAPALEAVIRPYFDILPLATRRWLDVSVLDMKMHLQDKKHTFPGINRSLTSNHKKWTQKHDYGNPQTNNSTHP